MSVACVCRKVLACVVVVAFLTAPTAICAWSVVGNLQLQPKAGSDLTKVLLAKFRWVPAGGK